MKRFPFLQVAFLLALTVAFASCTLPREASGYYDDEPVARNPYYDGYGTRTIVVERDPFTGRYYEVSPYGNSIYPSAPVYDSRYYNNRQYSRGRQYSQPSRGYNQQQPRAYSNPDQQYRSYPQTQTQQTPEQREEHQKQREDARNKILGEKKDN